MCLESLVAIMALVAACTLEPGVYLSMNIKGEPAATLTKINALNDPVFHATTEQMDALAVQVGEKSLFGRTGGAATLAVGMAQIFSGVTRGRWLDLWYHFAVMFEALFILTKLDAGTRVGRYILQDFLGHVSQPLCDTRNLRSNLLASGLLVGAWGWFLIQGVRDPLGGINSLWPLFGIANQMLAAIALCLGTTIILKMALEAPSTVSALRSRAKLAETVLGVPKRSPALAFITLIPLVWLLAVTFTAGAEKIWSYDPRIGFLAQAKSLKEKEPDLQRTHTKANYDLMMLAAAIYSKPDDAELTAKVAAQKMICDATWKPVAALRAGSTASTPARLSLWTLMAPSSSMRMSSNLRRFRASPQDALLAINWVLDSITVSMILRLLARRLEPVSVTSTMASASTGGLTSVAPQLNSTLALTPCLAR